MQIAITLRRGSDYYLGQYTDVAETQSACVILYLLEPSMDSGFQNLVVVRRLGITETEPVYPDPEPEPEPEPEPDPDTTNITVTKKWDDENNRDGLRPDKITVTLYADGVKKQTASFGEAEGWIYQFKDLPKTNANGSNISYTVEETTVSGYELTQENIYSED